MPDVDRRNTMRNRKRPKRKHGKDIPKWFCAGSSHIRPCYGYVCFFLLAFSDESR